MSEILSKDNHWLIKHGIEFESLEPEVQDVVKHLGKEGVEDLINQARGTIVHRAERLTPKERINLEQQLVRLADEGGGEWAEGEPSMGNKPIAWIEEEIDGLRRDY